MSEGKIVLGYWGVRGRAQPLRHIMNYCGLNWQEKIYTSPQKYGKDTAQMGMDFPNLPYLADGDVKFSQTLAIARYIPRKANKPELLGKDPADEAKVHMFYYFFNQILNNASALFFNKKIEDLKVGHFYKSKKQYTKIQKYLQGKAYCIGDYLTIVDFFVAEGSYYIQKLYPQQYKQFKEMNRIREIIQNLPQVQSYYKRQGAILTPFLPPTMTVVPLFWPGTQPKIPPAPTLAKKQSIASENKSSSSPQKANSQSNTQKGQQKQPSEEQPKEQKVSQPVVVPASVQEQDVQAQAQNQFYQPQSPLKVVIVSGSLSGSSSINYLLGALSNLGHPAYQFQWSDISALEIHNQDIDEQGTQNVNNLRGQIYQADGVLIGVSQTHHGVSVALTNTYNWLVPVLSSKPVGLVSVQNDEKKFRKILDDQGIYYFKPKLSVQAPGEFFNEQGQISEAHGPKVIGYMNGFARLVQSSKQQQ